MPACCAYARLCQRPDAAAPPPRRVMNSRRRMQCPQVDDQVQNGGQDTILVRQVL
jgi:hypothetical protein